MYIFGGTYDDGKGSRIFQDNIWRLNVKTEMWEELNVRSVGVMGKTHSNRLLFCKSSRGSPLLSFFPSHILSTSFLSCFLISSVLSHPLISSPFLFFSYLIFFRLLSSSLVSSPLSFPPFMFCFILSPLCFPLLSSSLLSAFLCASIIFFRLRFSSTWSQTTGDAPEPLSFHTCVEHDGAMWVFGGITGANNDPTNDVYQLDLQTHTWTKVRSETARVVECRGHHRVEIARHEASEWLERGTQVNVHIQRGRHGESDGVKTDKCCCSGRGSPTSIW